MQQIYGKLFFRDFPDNFRAFWGGWFHINDLCAVLSDEQPRMMFLNLLQMRKPRVGI